MFKPNVFGCLPSSGLKKKKKKKKKYRSNVSYHCLARRVSFLARRVSFLSRRDSFLSRRVSFLSRRVSFLSRRVSFLSRRDSFLARSRQKTVSTTIRFRIQPRFVTEVHIEVLTCLARCVSQDNKRYHNKNPLPLLYLNSLWIIAINCFYVKETWPR